MNFEQRALKARQRGDAVRAVVLLIEGLKRRSDLDPVVVDLLCEIYVEDIKSSGLEHDLSGILLERPDPERVFGSVLAGLKKRGKRSMGRDLIREARTAGLQIDWPPDLPEAPQAKSTDQPEMPDATESEALEPDASDSDCREEVLPGPAVSEPHPVESADAAPDALDSTAGAQPQDERVAERIPARAKPRPAAASEPAGKISQKNIAPRKGPRKFLFGLVAALVLLGGGWFWWQTGGAATNLSTIDAEILRSDPALRASMAAIFGPQKGARPTPPEVQERQAFMRAVYAAEWGEKSATIPTTESVWGQAAAATSFGLQGKFEEALSAAAKLEREHPGALATVWARGFVAESRGRFAQALADYRAGRQSYPEFAPFMTGQLRIALHQGRGEEAQKIQAALAELSPQNPYAAVEIVIPTLDDLRRVGTRAPEDTPSADIATAGRTLPVERPQFVRALAHLNRALTAMQTENWALARREVESALERRPGLGPALLLAGVLRAAALDIQSADRAWAALSEVPGLSMAYRWTLQIAAPLSLAGAGRPDLGFQYIAQVRALGRIDPRELQARAELWAEDASEDADRLKSAPAKTRALPTPRVPMLSVEDKVKTDILAGEAVLARAEVLSLLGFGRAAAESLELLDGVEALARARGVERARVAMRRGRRREARIAAAALQGAHQAAAQAELAFYSGQYEEAIQSAQAAEKEAFSVYTLRAQALSLAAMGRGRQALSLIQHARVSPLQKAGLRALLMRLQGGTGISGSGPEDLETTDFPEFLALAPTSVDLLVDLAHVAFWHKDFERARALAQQARDLAEAHPGANWVLGLLDEIRADDNASEAGSRSASQYFRAAWRDDPRDPRLLIEMGRIYLSLSEARRAQHAFYWALLRDRTNLAAIEGLGRAYMAYSRTIGVRDLSRILSGYRGSSTYLAQAVKTLKWLAILEGSREGKDAGLAHLEQAVAMVGESSELLVELARYRQAQGEADAARKLYARALEKDSTLAPARLGLARMALEAGDTAVALSQLRRYLRFSPAGAEAQWAQETIDKLSGAASEKLSEASQ